MSCRSILPELRAVYLAGSVSTGGFNPAVSDVDIIVVVEVPAATERLECVRAAVRAAGPPPAAGGLDPEAFAFAELQELTGGVHLHAWIRWYPDAEPHLEVGAPPDLADWGAGPGHRPAVCDRRHGTAALGGHRPGPTRSAARRLPCRDC